MAAYQSVSISYEESAELLTGYVDIDIIKTILTNILSSAVKNSFEGSSIEVKVISAPSSVTIAVEDAGVGLENELLEKLAILPPMQPCIIPSDEERLPGLGLLLSRELAGLHQGFLKVTQEEGKGTIYSLNINTEPVETEEED
ncbi:MAG: ATP-binding protein [Tannerellaceae bacterium]|nr:ATP-binding protein [Tannerellaceae bacterium]